MREREKKSSGSLFKLTHYRILAADRTTLLFDRGLSTTNLNDAAGSQRSNVAWADSETSIDPKTGYPTEYWLPGDDFMIPQAGTYRIQTIRVWIVGNVPDGKADRYGHPAKTHLTLWGGTVSDGIDQISDDYSVTSVTYANGQTYQGNSGAFRPINQIDFDVNFNLNGGETFTFFVDGPWVLYDPANPSAGYVNSFLHASNRMLSGSTQQGANDWFLWLHNKNGIIASLDFWNAYTGEGTLCAPDSPCPGNSTPSDANVQVFGLKWR